MSDLVGIRLQVYLLRIKVICNNARRSFICTSSHFWQPPSPPRVRKLDNFFAFEVESSGRARTARNAHNPPEMATERVSRVLRDHATFSAPSISSPWTEWRERGAPIALLPLPSPRIPSLSGGGRGRECVAWQKEGQQPTLNSPRTSPARPPAPRTQASLGPSSPSSPLPGALVPHPQVFLRVGEGCRAYAYEGHNLCSQQKELE